MHVTELRKLAMSDIFLTLTIPQQNADIVRGWLNCIVLRLQNLSLAPTNPLLSKVRSVDFLKLLNSYDDIECTAASFVHRGNGDRYANFAQFYVPL
jgi:hypothetical protein